MSRKQKVKVAVPKVIKQRADQLAQTVVPRYARLRERNQITLPSEITSALSVRVGHFIEISLTSAGFILLKPTALVTVGSPEAEQEEARATADITEGRYKTFNSAADLMADIKNRRASRKKIIEKETTGAS